MPIGEAGEVERVLLAVLALDGDAAALRIDPDDAGDIAVVAPRAAVVVGELDAIAGMRDLSNEPPTNTFPKLRLFD